MSRIWEGLFSKNGLAAREIAKRLLNFEPGDRIPRVGDFSKELIVGVGTVQGALKILVDLHAVQLESRGHLGTYLINKDTHLLKEIGGVGPFIGAMPLPYSRQYEGLATALIEISEKMVYPINLAYMRGSKQRLKGLKSRRYDFVVMSQLAAEEEIKKSNHLEIVKSFGEHTYVTTHKVFFANEKNDHIKDGMRIGIDHSSADQSQITLLECQGVDVEYIKVNYMQLFDYIRSNKLDAAVWNADEIRISKEIKSSEFKSKMAKDITKKASTAVVLIEKERLDVKNYFSNFDVEEITKIQDMVVSKKKLPHY